MSRSIHSSPYQQLCRLLIETREKAGLTQMEVAAHLKRPQSFVSKYERGERRLDVVELLEVSEAMGIDILPVIQKLQQEMRKSQI